MKLHHCQQGTSEWLSIRAGIPTASAFDRILTPALKPSKQAEKYLYQLLAERMMGHPIINTAKLWWADRGKELETSAVQFYELTRNVDTQPIGFIRNDAGTIGASPDRLVGMDGLAEFKCPSEAEHVGYLMQSGSHYEDYKLQVQGQLWISERQWVDVVSYHPEMPPALIRAERDETVIKALKIAVEAFSEDLERLSAAAEKRYGFKFRSLRNSADGSEATTEGTLSDPQAAEYVRNEAMS